MKFLLDHLEGFISAIALVVSIIGAVTSRYLTKKDMIKEQRADLNKEIYYTFFDIIFEFLQLSSPEFVDDIYDSIFDEYQYNAEDSLMARIDKAYVEISKRKLKLRLHIIKMETYSSSEISKTDEVLDQVREIYSNYCKLLDIYAQELKVAFDDNIETPINGDILKDQTNKYEDKYFKMVDWIKKYMKQMKLQLLS